MTFNLHSWVSFLWNKGLKILNTVMFFSDLGLAVLEKDIFPVSLCQVVYKEWDACVFPFYQAILLSTSAILSANTPQILTRRMSPHPRHCPRMLEKAAPHSRRISKSGVKLRPMDPKQWPSTSPSRPVILVARTTPDTHRGDLRNSSPLFWGPLLSQSCCLSS